MQSAPGGTIPTATRALPSERSETAAPSTNSSLRESIARE
jgi:hypothetical protein